MTCLRLELTLTPDWIAAEVMRAGLKAIVKESAGDPFGFSGSEAAEIAQEALQAAAAQEAKAVPRGA